MVGRLRHATFPHLHALTSGQDDAYHCLAEGDIMTAGFTVGAQDIVFRNTRMKHEPIVLPDGKRTQHVSFALAGFDAHMDWAGVCEDPLDVR